MPDNEYIKDRLDKRIKYYEVAASKSKKFYIRLSIAQIIMSASIPVLTVFLEIFPFVFKALIALMGAAISTITGILSLMCYRENWTTYRNMEELLRAEKTAYLQKIDKYADSDEPIKLLAMSCEKLMAKEHSSWLITEKNNNTQDNATD